MIRCCYGCVAPKRYPGCHAHCPEYIQEKAIHDAQNEAERKKKQISNGLAVQRNASVEKALRNGKRNFYIGKKL